MGMLKMFELIFQGDGEPHSATYEAQKWLTSNGYSYGSPSIDGPIGVVIGEGHYISKWRNMNRAEKASMDGKLYTCRTGPAKLVLKKPPDQRSA